MQSTLACPSIGTSPPNRGQALHLSFLCILDPLSQASPTPPPSPPQQYVPQSAGAASWLACIQVLQGVRGLDLDWLEHKRTSPTDARDFNVAKILDFHWDGWITEGDWVWLAQHGINFVSNSSACHVPFYQTAHSLAACRPDTTTSAGQIDPCSMALLSMVSNVFPDPGSSSRGPLKQQVDTGWML